MNIIRCPSSIALENLTIWRNPQGSEENWLCLTPEGHQHAFPTIIKNRGIHLTKVFTAEVGFAILATTALTETVAYGCLKPATFLLKPLSKSPDEFRKKLVGSSSYTFVRVSSMLFGNLLCARNHNLYTNESLSRARISWPRRADDIEYAAEWIVKQNRADWSKQFEQQGALFLAKDLLMNANLKVFEKFKRKDPDIIPFILTRSIYEYAFGSQKHGKIPNFFKPSIQAGIYTLRKPKLDREEETNLQRLLADPELFNIESSNEFVREAFAVLKKGAEEELQDGGLLSDGCWEKALELIKQSEPTIDQGVNFLIKDVLHEASEDTLEKLKNQDPATLLFILAKAIGIYAFGSKKDNNPPAFFGANTKETLIHHLRPQEAAGIFDSPYSFPGLSEDVISELQRLTSIPDQFNAGPLNEDVQSAFADLKGAASKEFPSGLFISKCIPKALETLERIQIDLGAEFLAQEVLSDASPSTVEMFKSIDPDIMSFTVTKSLYVYVAGLKKNDAVPKFFKTSTQNNIKTLRLEFAKTFDLAEQPSNLSLKEAVIVELKQRTVNELKRLLSSPDQFNTEPLKTVQSIFNSLRGAASEELQGGSVFGTKCWIKAIEMLNALP